MRRLALNLAESAVSPVRLPPGCARLATSPLPTGSAVLVIHVRSLGVYEDECRVRLKVELAIAHRDECDAQTAHRLRGREWYTDARHP